MQNIPKANLRAWNNVTKYCYFIKQNCAICDYFPEEFKADCKVKYHVELLCKKFGKPGEK